MLILDTHIWIWWNQEDPKLSSTQKRIIEESLGDGVGVCTISLIEIARLVKQERIRLPLPSRRMVFDRFKHSRCNLDSNHTSDRYRCG
jgi:PIN domain nuclease of toxin-antitoxin system